MKKLIAILIMTLVVFNFVGCEQKEPQAQVISVEVMADISSASDNVDTPRKLEDITSYIEDIKEYVLSYQLEKKTSLDNGFYSEDLKKSIIQDLDNDYETLSNLANNFQTQYSQGDKEGAKEILKAIEKFVIDIYIEQGNAELKKLQLDNYL